MDSTYVNGLGPNTKRYLDDNGKVRDPPGDVFIVDANNNLVASSLPPPLPQPLLERTSKVRPDRMKATNEELMALKEAIMNDNDVSYDKQLRQAIALCERASSWDAEATHELTALRWCWNVLLWRPGRNKKKVIKKNPNNPYMK